MVPKYLIINKFQYNVITYLHLLNAFCRLLNGSANGCWLVSTNSGGGDTRPGVIGVVGVLVGVTVFVGVAPPEFGVTAMLPSTSVVLQRICFISPWPSWLRSPKLHKMHVFPGLKFFSSIDYFGLINSKYFNINT